MTQVLHIEGMSCEHCAARVKKALEGIRGVQAAEVSLEGGRATVALTAPVDDGSFAAAVEEAGYSLAAAAPA